MLEMGIKNSLGHLIFLFRFNPETLKANSEDVYGSGSRLIKVSAEEFTLSITESLSKHPHKNIRKKNISITNINNEKFSRSLIIYKFGIIYTSRKCLFI